MRYPTAIALVTAFLLLAAAPAAAWDMEGLLEKKPEVQRLVAEIRATPIVIEYDRIFVNQYDFDDPYIEILRDEGGMIDFEDRRPGGPIVFRDGERTHPVQQGRRITDDEGRELLETRAGGSIRLVRHGDNMIKEAYVEYGIASRFVSYEGREANATYSSRGLVNARGGPFPDSYRRSIFDTEPYLHGVLERYAALESGTRAGGSQVVTIVDHNGAPHLEVRTGDRIAHEEIMSDGTIIWRGSVGTFPGTSHIGHQQFMGLTFPERVERRSRIRRGEWDQMNWRIARDIRLSRLDPEEFAAEATEFLAEMPEPGSRQATRLGPGGTRAPVQIE